MQYNFQWDRKKASSNRKKHGITFRQAAQVFNDPFMLTLYDDEHSDDENRWITLGQTQTTSGFTLVVIHTYHEQNENAVNIRIISARPASKHEIRQYEGR